jgi:hypothetical protein
MKRLLLAFVLVLGMALQAGVASADSGDVDETPTFVLPTPLPAPVVGILALLRNITWER